MGRISNPSGPDTVVFASETCAFDLLRDLARAQRRRSALDRVLPARP